jgi:hypothetical protein
MRVVIRTHPPRFDFLRSCSFAVSSPRVGCYLKLVRRVWLQTPDDGLGARSVRNVQHRRLFNCSIEIIDGNIVDTESSDNSVDATLIAVRWTPLDTDGGRVEYVHQELARFTRNCMCDHTSVLALLIQKCAKWMVARGIMAQFIFLYSFSHGKIISPVKWNSVLLALTIQALGHCQNMRLSF